MQLVDQGGDYVLTLKDNLPTLAADVKAWFDDPAAKSVAAAPTVDGDHGRIETRTATILTDIDWLRKMHGWTGLKAISKVQRSSETAGEITTETTYYVLSAPLPPEQFGTVVRSHWGVENRLHWRLDVVMSEDQDRTRRDNAPHNLAVLRRMAINLMQKDSTKGSLRGKFKQAGWNETYLTSLLALISGAIALVTSARAGIVPRRTRPVVCTVTRVHKFVFGV